MFARYNPANVSEIFITVHSTAKAWVALGYGLSPDNMQKVYKYSKDTSGQYFASKADYSDSIIPVDFPLEGKPIGFEPEFSLSLKLSSSPALGFYYSYGDSKVDTPTKWCLVRSPPI
jgi:hypothetical protein